MSERRNQQAGHGVTRAARRFLVRVRFGFFAVTLPATSTDDAINAMRLAVKTFEALEKLIFTVVLLVGRWEKSLLEELTPQRVCQRASNASTPKSSGEGPSFARSA